MADSALLTTAALAFSSGVATFFAPCAYPLLPGYVGYYVSATEGEQGDSPVGGAIFRGLAAVVGILLVFTLVAAVVFTLGQSVVAGIELLEPVIGLLLVVLGALTVTGRAPEWSVTLPRRRATILGFVAFGGVYAVAATGCTAPIFIALLVKAFTFPVSGGILVVGAYAGGMSLLMLGVTVLVAVGYNLSAGLFVRHVETITRLAGGVMILAGLGQLYLSIFVLEVL